MKSRIVYYESLAIKLLAFLILCIIWLVPFFQILHEILSPSATSNSSVSTALINSPPPWLNSNHDLSRWLELGWHSLRLGVATALMAIPASFFIAVIFDQGNWPGKLVLQKIWRLFIFIPLPITATIWLGSFSNLGRSQAFGLSAKPIVTGWLAASIVHALAAMPLLVWIFASVMRRSDKSLQELAQLDHPFPRSFFCSKFIQTIPAIQASAIIIVMLTTSDMTVTDLVQERTFAEESYLQSQMGDGLAAAASTALPPTVFTAILFCIWLSRYKNSLITAAHFQMNINPQSYTFHRRINSWPPLFIMSGLTLLLWILPIMAITWRAGRSGGVALLNQLPQWSLKNLAFNLSGARADLSDTFVSTLMVCSMTAFFSVILAWLLVETAVKSRLITLLLIAGCTIGLATPGPVAGLATAWAWMPLHIIYDSPAIVILAQLFRLLPIAILWVWPAITSRSLAIAEMIQLDRLSTHQKLMQVVLPGVGPLLTATFFIIFAMAFAELPASNIVAPPGLDLFSIRLWGLMHTGLESHLAAVVLLSMLLISLSGLMLRGFSFWFLKKIEKSRHVMK